MEPSCSRLNELKSSSDGGGLVTGVTAPDTDTKAPVFIEILSLNEMKHFMMRYQMKTWVLKVYCP